MPGTCEARSAGPEIQACTLTENRQSSLAWAVLVADGPAAWFSISAKALTAPAYSHSQLQATLLGCPLDSAGKATGFTSLQACVTVQT